MKRLLSLIAFASIVGFSSCKQAPSNEAASKDYFKPHTTGLQNGNIQMIPVETPKGKFSVWTKRIGCLPVVKGKDLVGIITEMDFMRITSRLLERMDHGN